VGVVVGVGVGIVVGAAVGENEGVGVGANVHCSSMHSRQNAGRRPRKSLQHSSHVQPLSG
jgi:hypothetical protein